MSPYPQTARNVIAALLAIADPAAVDGVRRFFTGNDPATRIMGVPIARIFPVAKRFRAVSLGEVEALLDDPHYEVRMAAVAIMDFKCQRKSLTEDDRKAVFDLYLRRHDRINNWDLVDRAARRVVGEHLIDKDRSILDRLATSRNPCERRTAIVSTFAFIRLGETGDTFRIAGLLASDEDVYVQKALGSWLREAGKRDPEALVAFLKAHAGKLPRPTITAASKLLPEAQRQAIRKADG